MKPPKEKDARVTETELRTQQERVAKLIEKSDHVVVVRDATGEPCMVIARQRTDIKV